MGWSEWSNAKKGGVIGGAVLATLILVGAGIGVGFAVSKPKKELDMWVPWTDTNGQYTAFAGAADAYNATNPEYKVVVHTADQGGYKESGFTNTSNLLLQNVDHKKKMPDIVVNNQDALAILQANGMVMNLTEQGLNVDDLYLNVQDEVSGIDDTADNIYALRMYSTQNIGIDVPLMNWMIANSNGKLIIGDGLESVFDSTEYSEDDASLIEKHWKVKDGTDAVEQYTIVEKSFTSQTGIHELADKILELFTPMNDEEVIEDISKDDSRGVVAFTNPQTEFFTSTQQSLGEKEMITVDDKGNEYNFLTEPDQFIAAGEVWDDFAKGMESGAYWLPGSTGLYSSSMVSDHYSIVTVGSTSGSSFNVNDSSEEYLNSDEIHYINDFTTFNGEGDSVYKSQGPSIMGVDRGLKDQDARTEGIIDFFNFIISGDNYVQLSKDGKTFENANEGDEGAVTVSTEMSLVSDFLVNSKSAIKHVEENIDDTDFTTKEEPGLSLAYSTISGHSKELLAEPNDQHTGEFWNTVKSEMNNQQDSYVANADSIESWEDAAANIIKQVNNGNLDSRGHIEIYSPDSGTRINNEVVLNKQ